MLILSRKSGEAICIVDNIEATILGVKGNQIGTGVNAPKNVQMCEQVAVNGHWIGFLVGTLRVFKPGGLGT